MPKIKGQRQKWLTKTGSVESSSHYGDFLNLFLPFVTNQDHGDVISTIFAPRRRRHHRSFIPTTPLRSTACFTPSALLTRPASYTHWTSASPHQGRLYHGSLNGLILVGKAPPRTRSFWILIDDFPPLYCRWIGHDCTASLHPIGPALVQDLSPYTRCTFTMRTRWNERAWP